MNSDRTEEFSQPPTARSLQTPITVRDSEVIVNEAPPANQPRQEATDARGNRYPTSPAKAKATPKNVSEAKIKMRSRLPALDDDADVGVEKEQIVTRDGKADLGFTGTLLASAAPASASKDEWQEYRTYLTTGGKHVFSKVGRTVLADKDDTYEAEVYDPSPSSVPTQLLRSARELARSRPLTWMDAAVAFFGYDPLAKALYRKLSVEFEEQI